MEQYQARYDAIMAHLNAGKAVMVVTYTQATLYKPKHRNMFQVRPGGLYVQRGKRWDCLNFTAIKFSN